MCLGYEITDHFFPGLGGCDVYLWLRFGIRLSFPVRHSVRWIISMIESEWYGIVALQLYYLPIPGPWDMHSHDDIMCMLYFIYMTRALKSSRGRRICNPGLYQ